MWRVGFTVWIFCVSAVPAGGQSFMGCLTYEFEITYMDVELQRKASEITGTAFFDLVSYSTKKYLISGDSLIGRSYDRSGALQYEERLLPGQATITYAKSGRKLDYHDLPMGNMENLKLIKSTREKQEILGWICRKYLYVSDFGEGDTRIAAWIAEGFPFDKNGQNKAFFHYFFFPEGLVFKKEVIHATAVHRWQLKKIETYAVPAAAFISP